MVEGTMRRVLVHRCAVTHFDVAEDEDHGARGALGYSVAFAQYAETGRATWHRVEHGVVVAEGPVEAVARATSAIDRAERLWEYANATERERDVRRVCAFAASLFRMSGRDVAEPFQACDDDNDDEMRVRVFHGDTGETTCVVDFARMEVTRGADVEDFSLVMQP